MVPFSSSNSTLLPGFSTWSSPKKSSATNPSAIFSSDSVSSVEGISGIMSAVSDVSGTVFSELGFSGLVSETSELSRSEVSLSVFSVFWFLSVFLMFKSSESEIWFSTLEFWSVVPEVWSSEAELSVIGFSSVISFIVGTTLTEASPIVVALGVLSASEISETHSPVTCFSNTFLSTDSAADGSITSSSVNSPTISALTNPSIFSANTRVSLLIDVTDITIAINIASFLLFIRFLPSTFKSNVHFSYTLNRYQTFTANIFVIFCTYYVF